MKRLFAFLLGRVRVRPCPAWEIRGDGVYFCIGYLPHDEHDWRPA